MGINCNAKHSLLKHLVCFYVIEIIEYGEQHNCLIFTLSVFIRTSKKSLHRYNTTHDILYFDCKKGSSYIHM